MALGTTEETTIRFACVDAPEKEQIGGINATAHLKSVLPIGAVVQIVPVSPKDRYDRQPGFVILNNLNMSVEQVTAGQAWVYTEYLGTCPKYVDILKKAQDAAQLNRIGLWGQPNCPPWQWRANKCVSQPDCKPVEPISAP